MHGDGLALLGMSTANPQGPTGPVPGEESPPRELPTIWISVDEERLVVQGIAALVAAEAPIYQRAGVLVRVVDQAVRSWSRVPAGTPTIGVLPEEILRMHMASAARWLERNKKKEWIPAHPRQLTARQIAAANEHWSEIRILEGVTETPVMRRDGTIIETPGYDPATGIIYRPICEYLPVAEAPSRDDAVAARHLLAEAVVDFPFSGLEHLCAWLACLLTFFARDAVEGCTPLHLIEAADRGTGKSLLADLTGEIALGRTLAVMPQVEDGEETRKRMLSLALSGLRAVLLDNVTRIGGPVMDAALTSTIWRDRILGVSKEVTAPLRPVWMATGNNVELRGDVVRRVNLIRLEADTDTPDARTGFRHDPLIPWIRERRPELVRACLTILRAYAVAGRPRAEMRAWGRYEQWSDHVRAPLIWAGLPDPCLTREMLEVSDARGPFEEQLFLGLDEMLQSSVSGRCMSSKEIVDRLANEPGRHSQLREAIPELIIIKPGQHLTANTLGYLLRRLKGKVRAGKRLCFSEKSGGVRRIYLEEVSGSADGDDSADDSPSSDSGQSDRSADGDDSADDSSLRNSRRRERESGGTGRWAPWAPSAPAPEPRRNSREAERDRWRRAIGDCPHPGVTVQFPGGETVSSK